MAVFMTKVWGWAEPVGPLQFGKSGWRDRARNSQLKPGDVVVMVATHGEQTDADFRGKIVGLMEPSREPVNSLDFGMSPLPKHFTDEGAYKWPYGLLNRAAWTFEEPLTSLSEITSRRFNMDSAQGLVELTSDEADKILRLPKREAPLLPSTRAEARLFGAEEARRRAAPPPTTTRAGTMHMRRAAAYTYALRLIGSKTEAYKIGWAFDWKQRARHFNQAAMPALGGIKYQIAFFELWPTAREAFVMEQNFLRAFNSHRHPANREVVSITADELQSGWVGELSAARARARGKT